MKNVIVFSLLFVAVETNAYDLICLHRTAYFSGYNMILPTGAVTSGRPVPGFPNPTLLSANYWPSDENFWVFQFQAINIRRVQPAPNIALPDAPDSYSGSLPKPVDYAFINSASQGGGPGIWEMSYVIRKGLTIPLPFPVGGVRFYQLGSNVKGCGPVQGYVNPTP